MRTVWLFILLAFASLSSFGDSLIRLHSPGLGKKATNAVLNAAIAYTDAEIANTGNAYTNLVISQVGLVWDYFRDPSNIVLRAAIDHADGATNAAISAAYAYTDAATNAVVESFIAADPNLWANQSRLTVGGVTVTAGNFAPVEMNNTVATFEMTDAGEYSVIVDAYAEIDASLFLAVREVTEGQKWDVLFTSGVRGEPIDFYLLVTVQPKSSIGSRDSKTLAYRLRRSF